MSHQAVWIDTDMGFDDLAAVLTVAQAPGWTIAGLSLVAGNAPLDVVTDNALRASAFFGWCMPIHRGSDRPLVAPLVTAQNILGVDGMASAGRSLPPARAALASGDVILTMMGAACTGTHYDQSASIEFLVGAGTVTGTSSPGRIRLRTTPDGSQTPTTRVDILANGQVNVTNGLDVGGTLTAQTGDATTASRAAPPPPSPPSPSS